MDMKHFVNLISKKRILVIFLCLSFFPAEIKSMTNVIDTLEVKDLNKAVQWIKLESLQLAIDQNKRDKTYDKTGALNDLESLKQIVYQGFEGLKQYDKGTIEKARKAVDLQRRILLRHPQMKDAKLMAIRYQFKNGRQARKIMAPSMGTAKDNWNNQQSNRYRGYQADIVSLTDLSDLRPNLSSVFQSKNGAVISDMRMHWNAQKVLFTSVTDDERLNVFQIQTDGSGFKPLIHTEEKDLEFYDAAYLPDGRLLAISNIGYQGVPCVHGDDPVGNMILYTPENKNIRRLTFDQDANWNPVVTHTGKVMYTRWEYTDLMHYYSRFVMHMNPDGTEQKALYGSGTLFPNSTFDIQPLPNHASAFVGIISGHHGVARSGRLIIFDPNKARQGEEGMVQELPYRNKKIEPVVKDRMVDGVWPQFIRPMPIDDKTFLVTAKLSPESLWGIYLVDVYDNLVCLYQEDNAGFISPLLVKEKKMPPAIPDRVKLGDKEATVFIQDIYDGKGLRGVPKGTVKSLRLHVYDYAYVKSASNHEAMGIQSGWDIKRCIGTVPVEEDGSAIFKIPANMPISIQPLDKDGRAVQWMRSWLTGQPGEVVSCVGCHEDQNTIAIPKRVIASTKAPSRLTPPKGGIRPFTFDMEVQPVLDRACVSCHNGSSKIDLRGGNKTDRGLREKLGEPKGFYRYGYPEYSTSYMALMPYIHRQGSEADMAVLQPYEYHANTSELIRMLEVGHHGVKLTKEEWNALTMWIDYNAPCVGVFENIRLLKGYDQYARRIELGNKYANASIDWKAELKSYADYLEGKGSIKAEKPVLEKVKKQKNIKVKGWPLNSDQIKEIILSCGEKEMTVEISDGISIHFVRIPAGAFVMGADEGVKDNRPAHKAEVEKAFWMADMEITNEQYKALIPDHDSRYVDQYWKDHVNEGYPANTPKQPVIRVSMHDAEKFCELLSKKTGLNITLPTETQWEWACRAGSNKAFWYGDMDTDFGKKENLADQSTEKMVVKGVNPQPMSKKDPVFESYNFLPKEDMVNDGAMITTQSDKYQANPFGLYSMHGNVAEWTCSPYRMYNEKDLENSDKYVVRGGSFHDRPKYSASYTRKAYYPWQRIYNVGFRVIINN